MFRESSTASRGGRAARGRGGFGIVGGTGSNGVLDTGREFTAGKVVTTLALESLSESSFGSRWVSLLDDLGNGLGAVGAQDLLGQLRKGRSAVTSSQDSKQELGVDVVSSGALNRVQGRGDASSVVVLVLEASSFPDGGVLLDDGPQSESNGVATVKVLLALVGEGRVGVLQGVFLAWFASADLVQVSVEGLNDGSVTL